MPDAPRSQTERNRRLEDQLRLAMFYSVYKQTPDADPHVRFATALVASARPIRDVELAARWFREYGNVPPVHVPDFLRKAQ